MSMRFPSSSGELIAVLIFGIGLLTVVSGTILGVVTVTEWLFDPTTYAALGDGLPWTAGGLAVGFVGGVWYAEEVDES